MKFEKSIESTGTLSPNKITLLKSLSPIFEHIYEFMFDSYGIEKIYIIEDFINEDIYNVDKIKILFEMDKITSETFIDSNSIQDILNDKIDYVVESGLYRWQYNPEGENWIRLTKFAKEKIDVEWLRKQNI